MIRHSFGSTRMSLVWTTVNRLLFCSQVATPVICVAGLLLSPLTAAAAEVQYVVKPVAEMKVKQLPKGPLYGGSRIFRRWSVRRPLQASTGGTPIR